MDADKRTELLSGLPLEALAPLLESFQAAGSVEMLKPPQAGLAMMRAVESAEQEVFHVGELLVMECTVSVDGVLGYGAVLGGEEDRALLSAIVDAVSTDPDESWKPLLRQLDELLEREEENRKRERAEQFALIRRSLVQFEMMDDEKEEEKK